MRQRFWIVALILVTVLLVSPLVVPTMHVSAQEPNAGWEEVGAGSASGGGITDNDRHSETPAMAIAPDGKIYVVWEEQDSTAHTFDIFALHWDSDSWEEVGAGSASGGGISNTGNANSPSIAAGPNGAIYVAWADGSSGHMEIYVLCWNGTTWVELDGSASGGGVSNTGGSPYLGEYSSIAVAPDGTVYVAWYAGDQCFWTYTEIYVRCWNGTTWVELDGSATGGGISNDGLHSFDPAIAVGPDGAVYVAWENQTDWDTEIYVLSWNGTAWIELDGCASGGGVSNNDVTSRAPSIAVSQDGLIHVTWQDWGGGDGPEIYALCWNTSVWTELDGSASGGGISNTPGDIPGYSDTPSIAVAPNGTAYIAWTEEALEGEEIYIRRWNGSIWAEVGAGSASNGGISDNGGHMSRCPVVAVAQDNIPYVAWQDYSSGWFEIYIRRYTGGGVETIDTGFRPNPDGYSFPNFEGFVPDDFTTNDLRRLFGDNAVCYGGGGGTCQVKPLAQSWYTESTGWLAENAHCDAFISTSLRFFTGYDTHPSFATTHDLQESSNVIANWQTYTSSTTARRNITFFMARAMVKPVSDAWESGYGEPDDTLTMLYSKMSAGGENLPTLFIRDRSHKSAHAVTPYAIEDLGAGVYHVRVYDSNSPSDPNRYIEIDTNANTWSCNLAGDMGGWNGDATSDSIGTQSISRYDEPAQPPWLIHGVDHIWLTAGNIALISNSQGLRIGLVGGQLINEIPGAYYRVVPTGDSTEPIYSLPITDTYTILLDGQTLTSSATAGVTQFGPGYGVSVDVGDIDSSTQDNITISPDGKQVSLNPNHDITEGLLEMAVDGDTEGYHFQIWDARAKAGETISLTNNDAQGWLSLSNADASVDGYTLDVKRVSAAGEQFFSHYVNIHPTDTHHIDYGSWDGGNTMALHIDHGSDGTVDETLVLGSQAVGIYLPIILKNY